MIVVDTSALVAVLHREPEGAAFLGHMLSNETSVGAPTKFEVLLVSARLKRPGGEIDALELLQRIGPKILDWTSDHAHMALDAELRYGKGRHPAKLNFGDCMAYAVAKSLDAPLLFKGHDFAQTDVRRVTG